MPFRLISSISAKNTKDVCDLLVKSYILPENLPPEEDVKKLKR